MHPSALVSNSKASFCLRCACAQDSNFIYKCFVSEPGRRTITVMLQWAGNTKPPFSLPVEDVSQHPAEPSKIAGGLQSFILQKTEIPTACNLHVPK